MATSALDSPLGRILQMIRDNPQNPHAPSKPTSARRPLSHHYALPGIAVLMILGTITFISRGRPTPPPSDDFRAGVPLPVSMLSQEKPEGVNLDRSKMRLLTGKDNDKQYPQKDVLVRHRPMGPEDHNTTLTVENLRIDDVVNQKAIDIGLSHPDGQTADGQRFTYRKVVVRNCEITNVRRDLLGQKNTIHIDFIRIAGGGNEQPFDTDVLIEDCYMRGGDAMPLIIQDGKYGTITIRRVSFDEAGHGSVQLVFTNTGHAKTVIVDQCPDLRVAVMGRPGTVGKVILRDSPGAEVMDPMTPNGRTGAQVVHEGGKIEPATEVATTPASPAAPAPVLASDQPARPAQTTPTSQNREIPLTPIPPPAALPRQPATPPANAKPAKLIVEPTEKGVRLRVEEASSDQLAFIIFEAFTHLDYRIGSPIIITRAPWEAEIPVSKPGQIKVSATITRLGGNPDKPLTSTIEIPRKQ